MVGLIGHQQAQYMVRLQPMKMAAAEALFNSEDPAGLSLLTVTRPGTQDILVDIRIPAALSLLSYNRLSGEVQGINQLQAQYEAQYGAGDYSPVVPITYWSFRAMVGAGVLMVGLAAWGLILALRKRLAPGFFLRWVPLAIALPYLANTGGWLLGDGQAALGRLGLMKTQGCRSLSAGESLSLWPSHCLRHDRRRVICWRSTPSGPPGFNSESRHWSVAPHLGSTSDLNTSGSS
jgi:cytochrome d ubiquinol oxidase subunit I